MLQYVADNLCQAAKRAGRIPDAAFTGDELLQVANEEMESYLVPLIVSAQEDYYEADITLPISPVATATYRIPPRAVGGSLREVSFLDAQGSVIDVPRISVDDLEQATWGVKLQSQSVTYVNRVARQGPVSLCMTVYLAPNLLCRAASSAVVAAVNGSLVTLAPLDTPAWALDDPPAGTAPAYFVNETTFDLVKGTPGFEILAFDVAGTCDGSVLTLASPVTGLEVGDYVSLPHTSPVPQCPTVLWRLLAQSVAAELQGQIGQADEQEKSLARRALLEKQVFPLIQNRIRGAPQSVNTRKSILRATQRW